MTGLDAALAAEDPLRCPPAGPATDPGFDQAILWPLVRTYDRYGAQPAATPGTERATAEIDRPPSGDSSSPPGTPCGARSRCLQRPAGERQCRPPLGRPTGTPSPASAATSPTAACRSPAATTPPPPPSRLDRLERAQAAYDAERAPRRPVRPGRAAHLRGRLHRPRSIGRTGPHRRHRSGHDGPPAALHRPHHRSCPPRDPAGCSSARPVPGRRSRSERSPAPQPASTSSSTSPRHGHARASRYPGAVPAAGEQVSYTLDPGYFAQREYPSLDQTPWTHGGPPARPPAEPAEEKQS